MKEKTSKQVLKQFLKLFRDFMQTQSKSAALRILAFMKEDTIKRTATKLATHNPHPDVHQSFEQDWEATVISLESWLDGKVDFTVSGKFLEEIKIWICEDNLPG
jgi:hypothetical protein